MIGRIAPQALFAQALAPFVVASAIERFSDRAVLEAGIFSAPVALGCFLAIRPNAAVAARKRRGRKEELMERA